MSEKKCDKECKCKCDEKKKKKPPKDPFTEEEAFFDINEYNKKADEKKGE